MITTGILMFVFLNVWYLRDWKSIRVSDLKPVDWSPPILVQSFRNSASVHFLFNCTFPTVISEQWPSSVPLLPKRTLSVNNFSPPSIVTSWYLVMIRVWFQSKWFYDEKTKLKKKKKAAEIYRHLFWLKSQIRHNAFFFCSLQIGSGSVRLTA